MTVIIYGDDMEEIMARIEEVFKRCEEWGITLSEEKYQFGKEVKFAGHIISSEGTKPDPKQLAALKNFAAPIDLTNLWSFMGLANQFSDYSPDMKHAMAPLKGLLSKKNAFV